MNRLWMRLSLKAGDCKHTVATVTEKLHKGDIHSSHVFRSLLPCSIAKALIQCYLQLSLRTLREKRGYTLKDDRDA